MDICSSILELVDDQATYFDLNEFELCIFKLVMVSKLRLAKNQLTACTIPNLKNQTHTFVFLLNAWENSVHKLEKIFNISL